MWQRKQRGLAIDGSFNHSDIHSPHRCRQIHGVQNVLVTVSQQVTVGVGRNDMTEFDISQRHAELMHLPNVRAFLWLNNSNHCWPTFDFLR
jgi:hypothetical protein